MRDIEDILTRRRVILTVLIAAAIGSWVTAALYLWQTTVPSDLALPSLDARDFFDQSELDEAASFERFLAVDWILAALAQIAALAVMAVRAPRLARDLGLGPVGAGIIVGMVTLVVIWAVSLPFGLAEQWWIRRHGLSREDYVEWVFTPYAELGALAVAAIFLIAVSMGLARGIGRLWWLAAAPVFVGVAVTFAFVLPYLQPFGSERLPGAALRAELPRLERETGAGQTPVRVAEASDITTVPNAAAMGLGPSEQVVLWDTLLDGRFSRGEIRFVLAHELGHVGREHVWEGLGWFALLAFPLAFAVAQVTRRRGGLGEPGNVPLAALTLTVLGLVLAPATNAITRHQEVEADWIALEATRDPAAARELFRSFTETTLQDPEPPGWAQGLFGTHPASLERIAMAEAWAARNP